MSRRRKNTEELSLLAMSPDEPLDIAAERDRAACALGLGYSDQKNPVFWQRNKQTEEALAELRRLEAEDEARAQTTTPAGPTQSTVMTDHTPDTPEASDRGAAPNSPQRAAPQSPEPETSAPKVRASDAAPESVPETEPAPAAVRQTEADAAQAFEGDVPAGRDTLFSNGQPAADVQQKAARCSTPSETVSVPWDVRIRAFVEQIKSFMKNRTERSRAGGVEGQKEEKKRQQHNALIFIGVLLALALVAIYFAGGVKPAEREPVRIYKSDFRLEPEALDKQSYQKQYEDKLARVNERLHTLEELAARMERQAKEKTAQSKAAEEKTQDGKTRRPVNSLPDFSASDAGREAKVLMDATGAPVPSAGGPRLKRLAVSDPVKDMEAIRTAAQKRYAPVRAASADPLIAANRARHEAAGTYLPAGSFARAVVLAGATVSTGGTSAANPVPMLLEVTDTARLPNAFRANVKACFVTANATGDLSSERVWIRLERLSCMTKTGRAFDAKLQGYVTGDDGKTGVRARLVTRSGQAIASALLTGSISGLGKAVSLSAQNTTTYTTGAVGTTVTDSLRAGLGEGLESALDRIADYYIRLADKIFPCLEIDSGRKVDLILSQGLTVEFTQEEPAVPLTQTGAYTIDETENINSSERFGQEMRLQRERYR